MAATISPVTGIDPGSHGHHPRGLSWNFPSATTAGHIAALHPYPARFVPNIPLQAIREFAPKRGVVWDPFAGSGTTLLEANKLGHVAVGIDVNQLAYFMQEVFTSRLQSSDVGMLEELLLRLAKRNSFPALKEALREHSDIPSLQHWFSDGAIRAIALYLDCVRTCPLSARANKIAKLALSRVLVRVSRQQSDTQYRAVRGDLTPDVAFDHLRRSLSEVASLLPGLQSVLTDAQVHLRLGDARDSETYKGLPAPALVVTSPPYPNAYEYWLYHKYRMFWLDMDPLWSRAKEIGARPFYSGTGKLGPDDFRCDMRQVLRNIDRASAPETTQVWVVGDAIIKGELVRLERVLLEEAEQLGWGPVHVYHRRLCRERSSFQGIGRLKRESVLVLRRAAA